MPHISFEEAQRHIAETLSEWIARCPTTRDSHPAPRPGTHIYGKGYKGASETNPATILAADWQQLLLWWTQMKLAQNFTKSSVASLTSGRDIMDLCCECTKCSPIASRGGEKKQPKFVYHLKKVTTPPPKIVTIKASSNNTTRGDSDSLRLDYKIEFTGGSLGGTLNEQGFAQVTLPAGITEDNCRFGFHGLRPAPFKIGLPGLLPGGRYMVTITCAWP